MIEVLIALGLGYGIATTVAMRKKKKHELIESLFKKEETQAPQEKASTIKNGKKEHEKDTLDIMHDIAYGNELEKFSLVEKKKEKAKYQYLKNGVLITIQLSEDFIECQVKKDDTIMVDYLYDSDWDEYDRRVISRSLIEGKDRDEAMEIIEDFMDQINHNYWEDIEDLEIVDDLKSIQPVKAVSYENENNNHNDFDALDELERITFIMEDKNIDETVAEKVHGVIAKIKQATEEIAKLDLELDFEAKHVYDELIKKDLSKLFNAYIKLDDDNRKKYIDDVLDGLERIENKVTDILTKVESKNLHEVESILNVIKQRYKE